MLDGLDKVDWASLQHAYGPATDIPELLTRLAEEADVENWLNIYGEFSNQVFHQSTIYPATAYTIPFLNQILAKADVERTQYLLCLLAYFVQDSYVGGHIAARSVPPLFSNMTAVYEVVSRYLDFYLEFLAHTAPSVRMLAMKLCSLLRDSPKVLGQFLARLEHESDLLLKAQFLLEISETKHLSGSFEATLKIRDSIVEIGQNPGEAPIVRLAAAMVLAQMHSPKYPIPPASFDLLIQSYLYPISYWVNMEKYGQCLNAFELFPFDKHNILAVFVGLGNNGLLDGLFRLFAAAELNAEDAHLVGRELVDFAFQRRDAGCATGYPYRDRWSRERTPHNKRAQGVYYDYPKNQWGETRWWYSPGEKLTKRQGDAIAAVANNDKFWEIPTNLFSFFYGLPDSRDELRALIEKS